MVVNIMEGDVRKVLKTFPSDYFDCIVTSPPYWGLRDYGVQGQIGLEPTLKEYIDNMVDICREIRRVMKPTGTFWLNVGDTYSGLKSKNLCMVPNRLAIALQDDGWYVRSEIVWYKPNPMPESVTDRPTQAHEKIWLLTKKPKYYYDFYGVIEYLKSSPKPRGQKLDDSRGDGLRRNEIWGEENPYRNLRNVWSIAPKGYIGAHFATFPPILVERCIRAGSSAHGYCSECGSPFERIIEKGETLDEWKKACGADAQGEYHGVAQKDYAANGVQDASAVKARILAGMVEKRTVGWRSTCKCESGRVVPARVLDPFGGSGTTGLVADILGRDATLIELNPVYIDLAKERIRYENRKGLLVDKEIEFIDEKATLF